MTTQPRDPYEAWMLERWDREAAAEDREDDCVLGDDRRTAPSGQQSDAGPEQRSTGESQRSDGEPGLSSSPGPECVCGETSTRNCPVHGNGPEERRVAFADSRTGELRISGRNSVPKKEDS